MMTNTRNDQGHYPILYPGIRCEAVTRLRRLLLAADDFPYEDYGCDAEGYFGEHTEHQVRQFQRVNDLIVDGIVGPDAWEKLVEIANEFPPEFY